MKKKRNRLLLALVAIIVPVLLFYAAAFVLNASFRNRLPAWHDKNLSGPEQRLLEQVSRQAYFFTTADNIGNLGTVYYSSAAYQQADTCYRLAMEKDSGWLWCYYLGYQNLEQGDAAGAIEQFSRVIKKEPANYLALYYAGTAYQKSGQADSARIYFGKIIAAADIPEKNPARENSFPLRIYARLQLARLYTSANRLDSAEKLLTGIIESQPDFGPAYRALGNVYSLQEKPALAAKYTTRANDLADFSPPADYLVDKISLLSRSSQYLLKQIEDAVRSGNNRWALDVCNHALEYFPGNKYFLSYAMFENFKLGNNRKALAYLDRHYNAFQNDAKEIRDVTDLLYDKGYGEQALKYFHQLSRLMPQNADLARWLYDRGKKQEAVAMMNSLVKSNPQNVLVTAGYIRLLLSMGDDDGAQEYMKKLAVLSPDGVETTRLKAYMAEKQSRQEEAAVLYDQAYQQDPKDLVFTKEMIDADIRQKNWPRALRHFNRALEQFPNEPFLLEGLGRLLISCPDPALRNIPAGIEYAQRAFLNYRSTYATRLSAGKNLATVFVFTGDKKKAVTYINATISLAKKGNQEQEYVSYFQKLAAGK